MTFRTSSYVVSVCTIFELWRLLRRLVADFSGGRFGCVLRLVCGGNFGGGRVNFCGGVCCGGLFGCVLQLFSAASRLICGGDCGGGRVEWCGGKC